MLAGGVVAAGLLASAMVAWAYFPAHVAATGQVRQQLADLSQAGRAIEVDFRQFRTIRLRLTAYGIRFTERNIPADAEADVQTLAGSQAVYRFACPSQSHMAPSTAPPL